MYDQDVHSKQFVSFRFDAGRVKWFDDFFVWCIYIYIYTVSNQVTITEGITQEIAKKRTSYHWNNFRQI